MTIKQNMTKYAILHLHTQGKNNKDIAKELGITTKEVKAILIKEGVGVTNSIPTVSSDVTTPRTNNIISETSGKNIKGVSIMTQTASEIGDAFKKNMPSKKASSNEDCIYRPRQDS